MTGWLDQSVLRFEPGNSHSVIGVVTVLSFGLSAVMVLLAVIVSPFIKPAIGAYSNYYFAGVALLVATSLYNVYRAIHQSRLDSQIVSRIGIARAAINAGAALIFTFLVVHNITGWLWGTALGTALAACVLVRKADAVSIVRSQFDTELARRMAVFGFPLIGWALAHNLLNFTDRFLLEILRDSAAVGVYSSNYTLAARASGLAFGPMIQAVHPLVMNAWESGNEEEIAANIFRYTRYTVLFGIPIVTFSLILSRPLTGLFLDSQYAVGYLVVPLVTAGLFCWNLANIGHKSLEVGERTRTMLLGVSLALLVNLVLNVPLIELYGYLGAAIASLIGFILYPVFVYFASKRVVAWKFPWRHSTLAVICSSIIFVVYRLADLLNFEGLIVDLVLVLPAVVFYGTLLFLTGALKKAEIQHFYTMVKGYY